VGDGLPRPALDSRRPVEKVAPQRAGAAQGERRVKRLENNPWGGGPIAWLLANRRRFAEPVPCVGHLWLFNLFVAGPIRQAIEDSRNKPGLEAGRACIWCGCTDDCEWTSREVCSVCAKAVSL